MAAKMEVEDLHKDYMIHKVDRYASPDAKNIITIGKITNLSTFTLAFVVESECAMTADLQDRIVEGDVQRTVVEHSDIISQHMSQPIYFFLPYGQFSRPPYPFAEFLDRATNHLSEKFDLLRNEKNQISIKPFLANVTIRFNRQDVQNKYWGCAIQILGVRKKDYSKPVNESRFTKIKEYFSIPEPSLDISDPKNKAKDLPTETSQSIKASQIKDETFGKDIQPSLQPLEALRYFQMQEKVYNVYRKARPTFRGKRMDPKNPRHWLYSAQILFQYYKAIHPNDHPAPFTNLIDPKHSDLYLFWRILLELEFHESLAQTIKELIFGCVKPNYQIDPLLMIKYIEILHGAFQEQTLEKKLNLLDLESEFIRFV